MNLSTDPGATEGRRRELRRLLSGWCIAYPVLAYGMLGYDPNAMGQEDQIAISEDLRVLGYVRRSRCHPFSHAHTMTLWSREATWPEDIMGRQPYRGIPLRPAPELIDQDDD